MILNTPEARMAEAFFNSKGRRAPLTVDQVYDRLHACDPDIVRSRLEALTPNDVGLDPATFGQVANAFLRSLED